MERNKVIVRSVGSPTCKVALIGQAPADQEIKHSPPTPFVGAAGEILNDRIESAGLRRSWFYITNVVKEQPPDNDITHFIQKTRRGIVTTPAWDAYVKALHVELSMTKANVLIPLGNEALYALTGKWGITKWRGSILECPYVPNLSGTGGRKVIPTIHPAAVLESGIYLYNHYITRDLQFAYSEADVPDLNLPRRHIRVDPTFVGAERYLKDIIESCALVAFDIEVLRDELSCIAFARSPTDCMVINFTRSGRPSFTPTDELHIMRLIARILEDDGIKKVGHNLAFDSSFLYTKYGIKTRNMGDSMVAFRVMYPDFPYGLDFVTTEYTREPYYKDDGKKYMRLGTDERSFWLYCGKDACCSMEALFKIMEELKRADNVKTYHRQVSMLEPILYMTGLGLRLDLEGMKKAAEKSAERQAILQERLNALVGYELNVNSPQQLKEYFYVRKGVKPYTKKTKRGGYKEIRATTDHDAMVRLARRGFEEARLVLDIRSEVKMRSTYLQAVADPDGRLRSSVNPVGTKNGRLSSGKNIFGRGLNVQTMPPELRKFVLPDEGKIPYEIDYSQGENTIVSVIAPEPTMRAAFERGDDVHRLTAALIFGKRPEDISDEDGSCSLGDGRKSERFWGKKANHELNYGMGPEQFAIQMELPPKEGRFIYDGYHRAYPSIKGSYHRWVREALRETKSLVNLMGRRRYFLDRWGDDMFRDAYAFIPQSTIADAINERGILYPYWNIEEFHVKNQVHDSVWLQLEEKLGWKKHAEILLAIKASMEKPFSWRGHEFVIRADIKTGASFACECEFKNIDYNVTELADRLEENWKEISRTG